MNHAPRAPHPLDTPNAYPEPIGPVEQIGYVATAQEFNTMYPNPEKFATDQKPAPHWEEGRFAQENNETAAQVRRHNREADAKIARGERLQPREWKVGLTSPRGIIFTYITPAEKAKQAVAAEQTLRHRG